MNVLDHGYVNLVESWGSDERIIEAARMSTDKGFQGWGPIHKGICSAIGGPIPCHICGTTQQGDEKLLSYLWNNKHHTPFEMAGFTIEIQAPIFVVREWHRHRTQSYNELSGRYTTLPDLYYIPSVERLMAGKQATKNKQSSEAGFTEQQARDLRGDFIYATEQSRKMYELMLERGVSRELSRLVIPVNQYTRFRASANLRNWLGFLALRCEPSAQWEIRQYAEEVAKIVKQLHPRTYKLSVESKRAT